MNFFRFLFDKSIDVKNLMLFANISEKKAKKLLKISKGDIVDALMLETGNSYSNYEGKICFKHESFQRAFSEEKIKIKRKKNFQKRKSMIDIFKK